MARMAGQVFTDKSELLANNAKSAFAVDSNLQGKLGADLGDTAGIMVDLERDKLLKVNDGNPVIVVKDGNKMVIGNDNRAAYPFPNKGDRCQEKTNLPRSIANRSESFLYNNPNQNDTLSGRGPRGFETELEYGSAMRYGYTPGLGSASVGLAGDIRNAPGANPAPAPSYRDSQPAPVRRPAPQPRQFGTYGEARAGSYVNQ